MTEIDTEIRNVKQHVYLGEYDSTYVIGGLASLNIFISCFLAHKDTNKRGIELYSNMPLYDVEKLFVMVNDRKYKSVRSITNACSIGQGMYGFNIYFTHSSTIRDVIEVIRQTYLYVKLTNTM